MERTTPESDNDSTPIHSEPEFSYQQMAEDHEREAEALAWAEAMIGDVTNED